MGGQGAGAGASQPPAMPGMGGMGGGGGGMPNIPPNLQNAMAGMNPAMMNQLMQRFGGMGMGGAAQAPPVGPPVVG